MKKSLISAALAIALGAAAPMVSLGAELRSEVEGYYRFEKFKPDVNGVEIPGSREVVSDWKHNLIVNGGMDLLSNAGNTSNFIYDTHVFVACRVGTGSTAPANTDTGLVSQLASTTTVQANTSGMQASAPYYGWQRKTWRFALGAVVGNVAEVGIFTANTGGTMFSRALVESAGVPTTFTILADEQLDVVYEFRMYSPTGDVAWGPTDISGVSYSGTIRAANVDASSNPGPGNSRDDGSFGVTGIGGRIDSSGKIGAVYSTQTLGAIISIPAGTAYNNTSLTLVAYTNGTFYRDVTLVWDLNDGNAPGGVGSLVVATKLGSLQMSFTPVILKDATKRLTLTTRVSWARKVI